VSVSSSTQSRVASPGENTRVALIKCLSTNNRFYALASPESGVVNAGTVPEVPHDLLLGIAYPCLEDALNDFSVIRTSFETLELFKADDETRTELWEIIHDARCALTRRLMELLERIIARKAYFLGTDLSQFKMWTMKLIERGISRYDIDTAMKVNVFSSVAVAEQAAGLDASPRYRYEFHNSETAARLATLEGRDYLVAVFSDVLDSVLEDENYANRYTFDRNIFQQFIALLFVTYAATDSIFYGTHRDDYGVSSERDMENTPLYTAVGSELRRLAGWPSPTAPQAAPMGDWEEIALAEIASREGLDGADLHPAPFPPRIAHAQPHAAVEETLLSPISAICAIASQLHKAGSNPDLARMILTEASRLVQEMKQQGIISPLAYNPGGDLCEE
jgi:hypothetical protein